MSDIDKNNLNTIAQGFAQLNDVLDILSNKPLTLDAIADRSISGDKIYAGKIAMSRFLVRSILHLLGFKVQKMTNALHQKPQHCNLPS